MAEQQFTFDQNSRRFRDVETGKFVSERAVRDGVDRVADLTARRMGELTARYRAGELTIGAWQAELMAEIKSSQIAAALAAYGGRANMSSEKWGFIGYRIREQFQYSRQMVADVLDGRQRINGRLEARARMYGGAARQTYNAVRAGEAQSGGLRYERNVMGAAEHCQGCRDQTAKGQVPRGTLVPPGYRQCRSSCRCHLVYSNTYEAMAS